MSAALVRAEARRVLATPSTWWLLTVTAALGVAGTLPPLLAAEGDRSSDAALQQALHGAAAGVTLVVVAGILATAGEWRHGQASQTFTTAPRRVAVVTAKAAVHAGVGLAHGLAAGVAALATAVAWYGSEGDRFPLGRAAVWTTLGGCLLVAVLFGVLGVGLGALVRNQVSAVVGSLAWFALVEPVLFAAAPRVFRWLPGMASFAIRRQPTEHLLPTAPALVVVGATVAVALAAGARAVARADITD